MNPHARHLKELKSFFGDAEICRESESLLVELALRLAAAGHAAKVLAMVERSSEAALFGALADGLRLHLGKPVDAQAADYERARRLAEQIGAEVAA